MSRLTGETAAADVLTAREFEVLRMLLAERTAEEISATLHISPKTVANLHSLIKDKLGVGSDIELVRLALRQGILTNRPGRDVRKIPHRNRLINRSAAARRLQNLQPPSEDRRAPQYWGHSQ
jgi:DNA-binding CsgD family transcriptional regulator